jgi:hypothetical protein
MGFAVAALAGAVALAIVVGLNVPGGESSSTAGTEAPPVAAGAAEAAGIQVDRASVDAGRVPLNTPIQQQFRLRNTGDEAVALGRARVEVLEGC